MDAGWGGCVGVGEGTWRRRRKEGGEGSGGAPAHRGKYSHHALPGMRSGTVQAAEEALHPHAPQSVDFYVRVSWMDAMQRAWVGADM